MSPFSLQKWLDQINNWVWGPPLIILLTLVGLVLTFRLRGVQFRYFLYAHKLAFTRDDSGAEGDISHFQALMTCLAATIGIGSITGVATAVAIGGLGSIFWMWMAALLGMATKFGEAILAIKYRIVDDKGEMCGGPMYYLERGLNSKFLARMFALLASVTALGTGNMIQSNAVADAMVTLIPIDRAWIGIILMILAGAPLIGGIKSIGKVVSIVVPMMALFYLVSCLIVLAFQVQAIPHALKMIVTTAFTGQAAAGGFIGSTMLLAMQMGVSRGVFSSEAGLGSGPIAAAAAKTDSPGRQALVSMSSVFFTTGIVGTLTGLVIATTGVLGQIGEDGLPYNGSVLALKAFESVLPGGGIIIALALIFFAYSTILGWSYFGEKCVEYLFGRRGSFFYRILFTLAIFPGALLQLGVIWGIANIMNGLMAFPNLIGLFLLSGVIVTETKLFDKLIEKERLKRAVRMSS